ncbi:class I SAM-dependent methyltransferase [Hydrocarboniclastica marina]|uniref:Ribosomal RNA small subunit methyltransferase J n=1 Tax=Hydrocarboniclastica marina TaxID=2259620 RepID=A0A4P7XLL3_9ALTE|nr:class I SAM-dependent methyltransferase [Hydrocarboniclastica marina]QCF27825.1 SAM-dependent methyltransferase [Hydrocarboniclastica marina]
MQSPSAIKSVAVACEHGLSLEPKWQALAARLQLPVVGEVDPRHYHGHAMLLFQSSRGLVLQQTGKTAPGPVIADFLHGKADYRRKHGGGRGQLIAKAVGVGKRSTPLAIIDATAGLGQDAFVLATLGASVRLLERSAIVAAVLEDGIERLSRDDEGRGLAQQMELTEADASVWLATQPEPAADVIYLDPMFPHRGNSASVKKEMTAFQTLVGADDDAAELLAQALKKARFRVVVKRPRKAAAIAGPRPDLVVTGKSTRYDVYIIAAIGDP